MLDGTGEGFPTPPAANPEGPDLKSDLDPEAWLENVLHSHLSDSQWDKLRNVLIKYRDAFSKSKTEIGCCNYFKVDLPLKPGTGYLYNKPRPLPFKHREIAAETISELLAKGVIRPSKSPHATNIVCVKNYNGFQRMEAFVWAVNKINRFFMLYIHLSNDLNITYLKPSIRVFKFNMSNSNVASISSNTFCIL